MRGQVGVIDIVKTRNFQSQEDRPANFAESGFWYVSMCVWQSDIGGLGTFVCMLLMKDVPSALLGMVMVMVVTMTVKCSKRMIS